MCIRDPIIPDHLDWMLQDLFIQGFEPQQLRMILRQSVWRVEAVSYTHLDVYKRQTYTHGYDSNATENTEPAAESIHQD